MLSIVKIILVIEVFYWIIVMYYGWNMIYYNMDVWCDDGFCCIIRVIFSYFCEKVFLIFGLLKNVYLVNFYEFVCFS